MPFYVFFLFKRYYIYKFELIKQSLNNRIIHLFSGKRTLL